MGMIDDTKVDLIARLDALAERSQTYCMREWQRESRQIYSAQRQVMIARFLWEEDAEFIRALLNSWPQLRADLVSLRERLATSERELLAARDLADAAKYTVLAMEWEDTDLCRALAAWRRAREQNDAGDSRRADREVNP